MTVRRSGAAARAVVVAFAIATVPGAAAPAVAADAGLAAELDALFAAAYPADGPGAAVRIDKGGETVLRKGYGMADLELGVPIEPGMVFRLGSITKQFTGAAVLLLAQEGKLDLSATVGEVLPGYTGPAAPVTVHQLLTHTGGVPSYTDSPDYVAHMREDVTVEQMIDRFRGTALDFDPGTDWHYSNSGYFLLGRMIEELSGTSYEEFVERRIFEPLGMSRTRYGNVAEVVPGRVEGYEGAPGDWRNASYLSMTQPYSAGSLLSTVDDLARWDEALEKGEILTPELRELLWTPAELADGRSTGYGYGFAVDDYQGHRLIQHGGGINGFLTQMIRVPEEDVFVAVFSNTTGIQPGPSGLAFEAVARVLGVPLDDRPAVAVAPETLDEYVGVYRIEARGGEEQVRVVTREGDQLFTQRSGGAKLPVEFSAADRFFYPDSLTTGRFERGEGGDVAGMWLDPPAGPEEHAIKTDRPIPPEREAVDLDPALLDRYVGTYELVPGFEIEVTREGGQLHAQATGQPRFEIYPESEARFFLKVVDAVIEFHGIDDGQAAAITLHQGGREMPGKRIDG